MVFDGDSGTGMTKGIPGDDGRGRHLTKTVIRPLVRIRALLGQVEAFAFL